MNSKQEKLLNKRKNHWYQFGEGELDHTLFCIEALKSVDWAKPLVSQTERALGLMEYFDENRDKAEQPDWIAKWEELEQLRTSFFEVRYAFDLYKRGIVPVYEAKTLGESSVDFQFQLSGSTFNIELVSTVQTESMAEKTEHLSAISKQVITDPADELRKVQSKIVRKVAKLKGETYVPHKFLEPTDGVYNMILADTRGFNGGDHLEPFEKTQMVWGCEYYLSNGGHDHNAYFIKNMPMTGLFDPEKEGEEASLFRARIHLLGIVSEKKFGVDQVIQQTHLFRNHLLPDGKLAFEKFTLAGDFK